MPRIKVDKKSLEGSPRAPIGIHMVRVDGFEPKKTKDGSSVNLQPVLKIINSPENNDVRVWDNLNSTAGWIMRDFCHAFGVPMEGPDQDELPGEFQPPDEPDVSKWHYVGPLMGKTGRLEVALGPDNKGGQRPAIKRYFCQIPGCQVKHSDNLIR